MSRPETEESTPARAALVTLAIGSGFQDVARATEGSLRRYANRHGLDFVIIDEPLISAHPVYDKFACYHLLDIYERLIFVDSDVLIAPETPNLLDIVPEDSFGAYMVSDHTDLHDEAIVLVQEVLGDLSWQHDYFNGGVMVFSRNHKKVFDYEDPDLSLWAETPGTAYREQTYLNFKVRQYGLPIFDIGFKFNHTLAVGKSDERFGSFIIHCKGHRPGNKLDEVRRARFVLDRPRLRGWVVRWPGLTRAFDRIPRMPTPRRVLRWLRRRLRERTEAARKLS